MLKKLLRNKAEVETNERGVWGGGDVMQQPAWTEDGITCRTENSNCSWVCVGVGVGGGGTTSCQLR